MNRSRRTLANGRKRRSQLARPVTVNIQDKNPKRFEVTTRMAEPTITTTIEKVSEVITSDASGNVSFSKFLNLTELTDGRVASYGSIWDEARIDQVQLVWH